MVVTQTAATTRAFADQGSYRVDVGRDLLGTGAGSVLAGLVGAFPVNASPRTHRRGGVRLGALPGRGPDRRGRHRAVIPFAGVLKDLPLATLAGVLVFVATRIFHVQDLRAIRRFDRSSSRSRS